MQTTSIRSGSLRAIQYVPALFIFIVLLAGGCAGSKESASTPTRSPIGDWVVVGHVIPGVSAVSDSEAAAWHGTKIHYEIGEATSGTKSCPNAVYSYHTARADSLLVIGYRVDPRALGYTGSAKSRIGLTKVLCSGAPWKSMGGFVVWMDENRLYSIWDGAFFELHRESKTGAP